MQIHWPDRVRVRLLILLSLTFLLVSGSVSYLYYLQAMRMAQGHQRDEMLAYARVISLVVDPARHESLSKPRQEFQSTYKSLIEQIDTGRRAMTDIVDVYTVRRARAQEGSELGYAYVLDALPVDQGSKSSEGQTTLQAGSLKLKTVSTQSPGKPSLSRFNLLSTMEDPPPEIRRCMATMSPEYTAVAYNRAGERVFSAYAPIVLDGQAVGVVGIDRLESSFLIKRTQIIQTCLVGVGFAFFFGIIISWTLVSKLAPSSRPSLLNISWIFSSGLVRMNLIETTLYVLVGSIIAVGFFSFIGAERDFSRAAVIARRNEALYELREELQNLKYRANPTPKTLRNIQRCASAGEVSSFFEDFQKNLTKFANSAKSRRAYISKIQSRLQREMLRQHESDLELKQSISDRNSWMLSTAGIAGLLSLAAIAAIRTLARQQEVLIEAVQRRDHMQAVYQQLVEHLPIGLFAYKMERYVFSNPAWTNQIGNVGDLPLWPAFIEAIHPDDRRRVKDSLQWFELERSDFQIEFRMGSDLGVRYMSLRGTPVYNAEKEFVYILAFAVDVTETVTARNELETKNAQLSQALSDLGANFEATVRALVKAIDAKDPYTAGHSERVMRYSVQLGRALGLSESDIHLLEMGAIIHDIGKIGIPDAILTKKSSLTKEEFEVIKTHPTVGYNLIQGIPLFGSCAEIVLWHHERLDGTGYPHGLRGEQVPDLVRIVAICDSFDAMTSTRAYRKGMATEEAVRVLRKEGLKGLLDMKMVEVFADIVEQGIVVVGDTDEQMAA